MCQSCPRSRWYGDFLDTIVKKFDIMPCGYKRSKNMQILDEADLESIQVLINEFIVSVHVETKENIAIELLNYLRKNLMKVQDGKLFNELCTMIEKKLNVT